MGRMENGQWIVEDLISTGGSSLKVVDVLRAADIRVAGMVAIFTYGFEIAEENFRKKDVQLSTICDYTALIETALEHNYITDSQVESLSAWRVNPSQWRK